MKHYRSLFAFLLSLVLLVTPALQGCDNGKTPAGTKYKMEFYSSESDSLPFKTIEEEQGADIGDKIPADPSKDGDWQFDGWRKNSADGAAYIVPTKMPAENVKLYPKFSRTGTVDVTFFKNDGTGTVKTTFNRGAEIAYPPVNKPGYLFDGWYTDEDLTVKYTSTLVPDSNTALYAKWNKDNTKVSVTFLYLDGTVFETKTVTKGEAVAQPKFDDVYILSGWKTSAGAVYNFTSKVNENLVLTADYYSKGLLFDGEGTVLEFDGLSTVAVVPAAIDGVTVTKIGDDCFTYTKTKVTRIILPDTVTEIGAYAFADMQNLTEVNLPAGLETLGEGAFSGCEKLGKIDYSGNDKLVLDGGAIYNAGKTELVLFIGKAESFTVPATVARIDAYAFAYADIGSLTVNSTVTAVGLNAFQGSRVSEVVYNSAKVPASAFSGCTKLRSVRFGSAVTEVGSKAFQYCETLDQATFAGTGKVILKSSAFESCKALTEFPFEKVTFASGNTFKGAKIRSYTLAEDTVKITDSFFSGWEGLESISIPDNVTSIEAKAFQNCSALAAVTISAQSKLEVIGESAFYGNALTALDLTPLTKLVKIEANAFNKCGKLETVKLPKSLNEIGSAIFSSCGALKNVELPFVGRYSYTGYKNYVFKVIHDFIWNNYQYDWTGEKPGDDELALQYLEPAGQRIYNGAKSLANFESSIQTAPPTFEFLFGYVFGNTEYQNSIAGTQSVEIGAEAESSRTYYFPSGLESIKIHNKIISANAFVYLKFLTDQVKFTAENEIVGNYAFYGCESATNYDFTAAPNLKSLGANSFVNTLALENVVIPDTVTVVGANAFYGSGVKSVKLPDHAEKAHIGGRAFGECDQLTTLYVADGTKTEGEIKLDNVFLYNFVFSNCDAMTVVRLGDNVEIMNSFNSATGRVESGLFMNCQNLREVYFNKLVSHYGDDTEIASNYYSPTAVPLYMFYGCVSLKKVNPTAQYDVTLPDTVDTLGYGCFQGSGIEKAKFDNIAKLWMGCLSNTKFLTEADLSGATEISASFGNCVELRKVILSDNLTKFQQDVSGTFENCVKLDTVSIAGFPEKSKDGAVYLPSKLRELKWGTFKNSGVREVYLPEGLEYVCSQMFMECKWLESVTLSSTIKLIDRQAFQNCPKLAEVNFNGNKLEMIGANAFSACSSMTEFIIPEGVRLTDGGIFDGCKNLESVVIPSTMYLFSNRYGFSDCNKLKSITLLGTTPANIEGYLDNPYTTAGNNSNQGLFYDTAEKANPTSAKLAERGIKIYVPEESLDAYRNHYGYSYDLRLANRTKTTYGWQAYSNLLTPMQIGTFASGNRSVSVIRSGESVLVKDGGNYAKAVLTNGKYAVGDKTYEIAKVAGKPSKLTVTESSASVELKRVSGTYIDNSYNANNPEAGDKNSERLTQYRPQISLSVEGAAQMQIFSFGATSSVLTDYSAQIYLGTYSVGSDGRITVTFTERTDSIKDGSYVTQVISELKTPIIVTIENGVSAQVTVGQLGYKFTAR